LVPGSAAEVCAEKRTIANNKKILRRYIPNIHENEIERDAFTDFFIR